LGEHLISAAHNQGYEEANRNGFLSMLRGIEYLGEAGTGRFFEIIRKLIRSEPKDLSNNQISSCLQIFNYDNSPENRLANLLAAKQLNSTQSFERDPAWTAETGERLIRDFFQGYCNGSFEVPPPGIQKAMEEFPELFREAVGKYADPFTFPTKLIETGESIGQVLSKLTADSGMHPEFSHYWLETFFSVLGDTNPTKADDIVREVVNNFNTTDLSKFSPGLLIELKLLLMRGDDTDLNQQMINEVINPAYEVAKNN
jgi:hypothetical protein